MGDCCCVTLRPNPLQHATVAAWDAATGQLVWAYDEGFLPLPYNFNRSFTIAALTGDTVTLQNSPRPAVIEADGSYTVSSDLTGPLWTRTNARLKEFTGWHFRDVMSTNTATTAMWYVPLVSETYAAYVIRFSEGAIDYSYPISSVNAAFDGAVVAHDDGEMVTFDGSNLVKHSDGSTVAISTSLRTMQVFRSTLEYIDATGASKSAHVDNDIANSATGYEIANGKHLVNMNAGIHHRNQADAYDVADDIGANHPVRLEIGGYIWCGSGNVAGGIEVYDASTLTLTATINHPAERIARDNDTNAIVYYGPGKIISYSADGTTKNWELFVQTSQIWTLQVNDVTNQVIATMTRTIVSEANLSNPS